MKRRVIWSLLVLMLLLCGCNLGEKYSPDASVSEADIPAPTWREQYDLGIRYISTGDYDEAIASFIKAIEIDPEVYDAYHGLGDAYAGAGDYDNAIEAYKTAILIDNKHSKTYIKAAELYVESGEYSLAVSLLEQGKEITDSVLIAKMISELYQLCMESMEFDFYLIDYALLIASLEKSNEAFSWSGVDIYLRDTDGNGYLDLIAPGITRISYDDEKLEIRFDGHGGAAGSISLGYLPESDTFICRYHYGSAGYQADKHRTFSGLEWQNNMTGYEGFHNYTEAELVADYTYCIDGIEVSQSVYEAKAPNISDMLPATDTHLISNYIVNCKNFPARFIMLAYEVYASRQNGYLGCNVSENSGIYAFRGYGKVEFSESKGYLFDEYASPDHPLSSPHFPLVYSTGLPTYTAVVTANVVESNVVFSTEIYDIEYKLNLENLP